MIDIGYRIREIRTSKKITVSKLAQDIGVAQSFVSGIEAGTKKCSLENLDKICHALGITLNDFFAPSEETKLSSDLQPIPDDTQQHIEIRRIIERINKLPLNKLKVLKSVLDTWVDTNVEKTEKDKNPRPMKQSPTPKVYEYPDKERNKLYIAAESSREYDKIDVRSTPMAAHLEDAESIPLTPELEDIIKDGIRESRQLKREREAKLKQKKKEGNNKATTNNE
ncbi:Transcriptional regulator, contains XRE-family HTH domain [Desulfotomaculum arcticum]|uniref:Transcriptional regulator, contains XRE-family HTH domain n=1 Tax=Desulfotruncus arcticus DSM 17038 TaxID=1121424 RepID=A0A1I2ZFL8_9FIRM|nr:helix-turn-helix transcriptional regulator [Desulfotruncus arcticus]SFH36309.1 Transcriptional regulator, contains XRE-family HTH domain [Desulfotomaculum arcticum] [Desulfotruncus arcticus DSM 17038]